MSETDTQTDTGTRYVRALAAKDTGALVGLFVDEVLFRGMTPGRFWEAGTPQEAVHDVLYQWFAPADVIEEVEALETGQVEDRHR